MPVRLRRKARHPKKLKIPLPKARAGRRLPPGICRLDYPRVRGYIVRISYRRTRSGWKPRFKAYFGDTRYGGKAKAFAAAQEWLRVVTETGRVPKEVRPEPRRARTGAAARRGRGRTKAKKASR